jgi:hypothetical protein
MKSSVYTKAMMSDATRAVSIIAAGALLVAGINRLRSAGA